MRVDELHDLMKADLKGIREQCGAVAGHMADLAAQLPKMQAEIKDVRATLYNEQGGLVKVVTVLGERQAAASKLADPGNKAARQGNHIALGALIVAAFALAITIIPQGGCSMAPKRKQTAQLENLAAVDTLDEYADLKKEITAMVKDIGKDARLELTGDRTYTIEADGSIYMQHSDQSRPVSTWRREEWGYFREDMAHNRLRQRLTALK